MYDGGCFSIPKNTTKTINVVASVPIAEVILILTVDNVDADKDNPGINVCVSMDLGGKYMMKMLGIDIHLGTDYDVMKEGYLDFTEVDMTTDDELEEFVVALHDPSGSAISMLPQGILELFVQDTDVSFRAIINGNSVTFWCASGTIDESIADVLYDVIAADEGMIVDAAFFEGMFDPSGIKTVDPSGTPTYDSHSELTEEESKKVADLFKSLSDKLAEV